MKKRILSAFLVALLLMLTISCSGDADGDSVQYGSASTIFYEDLLSSSSKDGSTNESTDESVGAVSGASAESTIDEASDQDVSEGS